LILCGVAWGTDKMDPRTVQLADTPSPQ